jgi:hypothetical protein
VRDINYADFRRYLDQIFGGIENQNSITHQLVDLTDLFQKIAAIYDFAKSNEGTAFQNPIVFQVVESALIYGVCIPIRRLADGSQKNEIALYKVANEIRANCQNWTRHEFLTWDGGDYDHRTQQSHHEIEVSKILSKAIQDGTNAAWIPVGAHEEILRRHNVFDRLSGSVGHPRKPSDSWKLDFAKFVLNILEKSAGDIVFFANTHLAHRVQFHPDRVPEYNVSLNTIESCIAALWNCYNILNSVFHDSYMTPDIVHSLNSFQSLSLPLVPEASEEAFIGKYEQIKNRMENVVNLFNRQWQQQYAQDFSACLKSG